MTSELTFKENFSKIELWITSLPTKCLTTNEQLTNVKLETKTTKRIKLRMTFSENKKNPSKTPKERNTKQKT